MMRLWPENAANFADSVDAILFGLTAICGAVAFLVAVAILTFCVRYRRGSKASRSGKQGWQTGIEITWTVIPLFIFVGLFIWAGVVYFDMSRPPGDALEIHVVGKQWMWKLQHPEGQREINELHVPVGKPVSLIMISQDVIHSFFVPAFRTKQDVVPGRYTRQWFMPTKVGNYHLFCAEYCGTDHSQMIGTVHVMKPADYADWLASGTDTPSMVQTGRDLFVQRGCSGCHADGSSVRAPGLKGIYRHPVGLSDGTTVIADDKYLRDSILLPNQRITAGYDAIMPSYEGQLDEGEVFQIIAYIKSLNAPSSPDH